MKSVKEQQNVTADAQSQHPKQKYVAPTIEVIQVQTEKGYAGSSSINSVNNEEWNY